MRSLLKGNGLFVALVVSVAGAACGGGGGKNMEADGGAGADAGPTADAEVEIPDGAPPDAMVEPLALEVDPTSLSVSEGGSDNTFIVTLNKAPESGSFTANIASDNEAAATVGPAVLTFDDANFGTARTVTVTAEQDDNLVDEEVTVSVSGSGVETVDVAVSVTDDDEQQIIASTDTVNVQEESTNTFTVELAAEPSSAVTVSVASNDELVATVDKATLSFDSGDWNVPQTVTVTGAPDDDVANNSTTVTLSSTDLDDFNVTVNVTDNDSQRIFASTVDPNPLDEEGGPGTFTVTLTQQPSDTVNVSVALDDVDEDAVTLTNTSLEFTSGDWDDPQTVTVMPQSDADALDEEVSIRLSATDLDDVLITANVTDDEVQGHIVDPAPPAEITLEENGAAGSFTVALNADPVSDATVFLQPATGDTGEITLGTDQITFTGGADGDWMDPKTVMVSAPNDPDLVDEEATIEVSSAIAPTAFVNVVVQEDDVQELVVEPLTVGVTEDNVSLPADTFAVSFRYQPAGTVEASVATGDPDVATASDSDGNNDPDLLFTTTTYDDPQHVTVTGTTDNDLYDEETTVSVTSGFLSEDVDVSVDDDDVQEIVLDPTSVTVAEGSADAGTSVDVDVSLRYEPLCGTPGCTETLTITAPQANGEDKVGLSTGSLGFTAANTPQTLTLDGLPDDDAFDENIDVGLVSDLLDRDDTVAGPTPENASATLPVTVTDPDTQAYVLGGPLSDGDSLGEGNTSAFTVALAHDPVNQVTVTVSSNNTDSLELDGGTPDVTLTFDSGDYGDPKTVTVLAPEDDDLQDNVVTLTVASADNGMPPNETLDITTIDNDVQRIIAQQSGENVESIIVAEEGDALVDVRLEFQPNGSRAVTVAGTGNITVEPALLTFDENDWNVNQPVTVHGGDDDDLDDDPNPTLTLTSDGTGDEQDDHLINVTVDDSDTQEILVSTIPADLGASLQEDGPTLQFEVSLAFPPRNDGSNGEDVVTVESSAPALLELSDDNEEPAGQITLLFDGDNFPDPQRVTMWAMHDEDAEHENLPVDLTIDGEQAEQDSQADVAVPDDFQDKALGVRIMDDEVLSLEAVTLADYTGATRHTKRKNISWALDTLALTAYDTTAGNQTALLTVPRDDLTTPGSLDVSGPFADSSGIEDPVETVEFDGEDVGVFASAGSIGYARFARNDLTAPEVGPELVADDPDAIDFWSSFNGTDYGLLYRNSSDNNLRFRLVALDGQESVESVVTTASASPHQHPNLHPLSGGGWVALYTTDPDVRCVRMGPDGVPVPGSNTSLTDPLEQAGSTIPAGVFVSSVINPSDSGILQSGDTVLVAYSDPSDGLTLAGIDGTNCQVQVVTPLGLTLGVLRNTPFVAFNGGSFDDERSRFAIAFDQSTGTMGVVIFELADFSIDGVYNVGVGNRPSITWAGDRWVVRALDGASDGAGAVYLESGSFEDCSGLQCGGVN